MGGGEGGTEEEDEEEEAAAAVAKAGVAYRTESSEDTELDTLAYTAAASIAEIETKRKHKKPMTKKRSSTAS